MGVPEVPSTDAFKSICRLFSEFHWLAKNWRRIDNIAKDQRRKTAVKKDPTVHFELRENQDLDFKNEGIRYRDARSKIWWSIGHDKIPKFNKTEFVKSLSPPLCSNSMKSPKKPFIGSNNRLLQKKMDYKKLLCSVYCFEEGELSRNSPIHKMIQDVTNVLISTNYLSCTFYTNGIRCKSKK